MATAAAKIEWQSLPAAKSGQLRIGGDLIINRLGYGTMRLTGKGIWGPPKDRNEAIRVLRRAVELGINFIDTADSYGPDVAEELIAEALHPYPAGLVIATKAGFERPGPDKWVTNGKPEHLRAACEGSLKRLRLDRIELFQLHRIDSKVPADDQLGALQLLQSEGKINHIGLSEVSVKDIEHARSIVPIVFGSESLQRGGPRGRRRCRLLRESGPGIHSLVSSRARRRIQIGHLTRTNSSQVENHAVAACARLALASVARDAADSRHFARRTSRRECGGSGCEG